jgi:primosomal protein N' (replication factor Y)
MIAEIIPSSKTFGTTSFFTYKIPEVLVDSISIGSLVRIPFGNKTLSGVVTSLKDDTETPVEYSIKEIKSVVPGFLLPKTYTEIAEWIAEYYLCSVGEALSLFLPPIMKRPSKAKAAQISENPLSTIKLSEEQIICFEQLKNELKSPQKKPALLHGVTGSGKTEIYIKLADETIKLGKQVIVLVPEIILTPQTVERFTKFFGEKVVLMHSNLSKSEKLSCYEDFYTGKKPIIVGPRSALMVPSEKIGLIIVDEEHEDSFKQEQSPRYHAVTLAEQIAKKLGALLVLGSATPRIETYYKTKTGEYDLFTLKNRYQKTSLPAATVVDLKYEIKKNNFSPISEELRDELTKVLTEKRQALLFLNRRGTATFVSCRDCGHVLLCKNCSIPMVYHVTLNSSSLVCHHCDSKEPVPELCPECQSPRIKYFGAGVEKIEQEIHTIFPDARVIKIDSTTIKSKNDYDFYYQKIKKHEVDIVIGTQMIAKGLDIPGVDLVGIVSADTGLHMPHYRASERSFQLLTQVSGRSGRRENLGKTVIQTYWPESAAIIRASQHDFDGFYEEEILARETHLYPPFTHLVRVLSEDEKKEKAKESLEKFATELKERQIMHIGPGACFYAKLHNKYRYHIIIKIEENPNSDIAELFHKYPHLVWDIDPTNML